MLTKRMTGLTEFVPTPQEKRDGVLRDHALALLQNLHMRLRRLEDGLGVDTSLAEAFDTLLTRIECEEAEACRVHAETLDATVI